MTRKSSRNKKKKMYRRQKEEESERKKKIRMKICFSNIVNFEAGINFNNLIVQNIIDIIFY